jgi:hypothetical protein
VIAEINRLTPIVRAVSIRKARCAWCRSTACRTSSRAHRSAQRPQRPGRRHAGIRAPHRRAGIASIGADTQLNVRFRDARRSRVAPRKRNCCRADGRRIVRRSDNVIEGQLRLDTIDNTPLAVMYTTLPRSVMQSGSRACATWSVWVALLISIVVARGTPTAARLRALAAAATAKPAIARSSIARPPASSCSIRIRAACWTPTRRHSAWSGASLDELRRRDVATIFDTPVSLEPGDERDQPSASRPAQIVRGDEERRDVEFTIADLDPGTGRVHAMLLQDISHRREAERRAQEHQLSLQHLATHDALTGLPNRTFLNENCRGSSTRPRAAAIRFRSSTSTATTSRTSTIHAATRLATTICAASRATFARLDREPGPRRSHGRRRIPRGHAPLWPRARQRGDRRTRRSGA